MVTSDDQKVRLATHMLAEEAEFWWTNAKGRLEVGGEVVTWARFKTEFLMKYFPEDLRTRKEVEFLNLNDCKKDDSCFKCGKAGHTAFECKNVAKDVTCYNCGEAGHYSNKCTKLKKAAGKVFALNAEEVEQSDNLIRALTV
ncbi:uncharacterized protein [Medicago truncatula]|uniref:uncharacterized protein n=1 Tax=Medicago truncatula TaxID=3880 RepID=UPI001967306E|nr:uncharacterized protein LOC120580645 [Medicago truncatula]